MVLPPVIAPIIISTVAQQTLIQNQSVGPLVSPPIVTTLPVLSIVASQTISILPTDYTSIAATWPLQEVMSISIALPDTLLPSPQIGIVQPPIFTTSTSPSTSVISPSCTPFYDPMLDDILWWP